MGCCPSPSRLAKNQIPPVLYVFVWYMSFPTKFCVLLHARVFCRVTFNDSKCTCRCWTCHVPNCRTCNCLSLARTWLNYLVEKFLSWLRLNMGTKTNRYIHQRPQRTKHCSSRPVPYRWKEKLYVKRKGRHWSFDYQQNEREHDKKFRWSAEVFFLA